MGNKEYHEKGKVEGKLVTKINPFYVIVRAGWWGEIRRPPPLLPALAPALPSAGPSLAAVPLLPPCCPSAAKPVCRGGPMPARPAVISSQFHYYSALKKRPSRFNARVECSLFSIRDLWRIQRRPELDKVTQYSVKVWR